jgi:phytoene dehydrogenase-like protein
VTARSGQRDAFVIGSGPNGLTAAITLARAGIKVTVLEAQSTIGGGTRSAELTLPGFVHDVCSAVHPMAVASPAFASMPLSEFGLEWIHPPIPVAHPLDGGGAATLRKNASEAGGFDGDGHQIPLSYFVAHWHELEDELLSPAHVPRHPLVLARFGFFALWPATKVAELFLDDQASMALFAGIAAHSVLPLEMPGSSAIGWVLATAAVATGWPIPRGGSQRIADALAGYFESLGGLILRNQEVKSLHDLPADSLILCDITPKQMLRIGAGFLPDSYCRKLERYRYGPGVFKVDWALRSPIPWANEDCRRAGTVHVGGTLGEIAASERAAWNGENCARPFVLLAQPSLFDDSRAPAGSHTAWAYCHVPNGSRENMTDAIEAQIERFAPGFRQSILARHTMSPADLEAHNANLVGGDITGGAATLRQILFRPTRSLYRTPRENVFLCSASTPPGGGVHGMCGYHAARAAIATV